MAKMKLNNKMGKSLVTKVVIYVLCALLVLYSLTLLLSLYWGLITSLKNAYEFSSLDGNKVGFPILDKDAKLNSREQFFKLKNYVLIFQNLKYFRVETFYSGQNLIVHQAGNEANNYQVSMLGMLGNTMMYTIGGAAIYAFMPCMTAYLCAKYDDFKLSGIIYVVYLFMMCMPIVGNYPTELTFLRNIGIYDTIWGNYIQKMTGSGMYFFVYFAYFKGVSNTYREAAEIDGAPQATIMFGIYFPLAIKMISTVFLIQFVNLWNDYQTPLLYLPTYPTIAYGIFLLNSDDSSKLAGLRNLYGITPKMAGCMLLAVPITIIFVIFKERLMGDVSLGGIKE